MELKFINIGETITLPSVGERTKLWKLISDFVEFKGADDHEDPFQQYRGVSYGGLSLYLKAEGQPAPGEPSRHFYPLDMKRSLKTVLKNTRIVEHPIIHVVFTRDEHMYREDLDYILFEEDKAAVKDALPNPNDSTSGDPTLGDVLSHTDAMQADPEAYKQYFDFYLKYYTSKYAQQGVAPDQSQSLPNPFAGQATQFPNLQNLSSNTFPSRSQLSSNTIPKSQQSSNTFPNPRPQHNPNPRPQHNPNLNPNYITPNTQKYPNRSHYQAGPSNHQFGQKFSHTPSVAPHHQHTNQNINQ